MVQRCGVDNAEYAMTDYEVRAKFGASAIMGALGETPDSEAAPVALSDQALEIADRFSGRPASPRMVAGFLMLFDLFAIFAAGLVAHTLYVAPYLDDSSGFDLRYGILLATAPFLFIIFLQSMRGYDPASFGSLLEQSGRLIAAWTLLFASFAVSFFFFKLGTFYSRLWFAVWYGGGLGVLLASRLVLAALVDRWQREGRFQRRAIIVGGGAGASELIRQIEASTDRHIQICGIFDDRSGDRSPSIVQGYPRLGTIAELVEFGRIAKIDMLIVSLPLTAENRLLEILKMLWVLPVDIRLSAHSDKLRFRPRSYSYIGAVPFLDVVDRPIADWDSIAKRAFDLFFATLGIIILGPLMMVTAVAIRLDSPGPILFRQKRYGFNNEVIDVLKFRSMYADQCDYESRVAVTKDDPRVTAVGRIMRKTSIDELPQLFNVIFGTLSLVGPRPHAVGSNTENRLWESVVDGYFARHKVKPGVTGWAQIHGWRGEVDTSDKLQARVAHDLYYIENWSPLLDLRILLRTPFALVNPKNAY
jgi:Undecaprenyl-phosphate glucose phosphotransferase